MSPENQPLTRKKILAEKETLAAEKARLLMNPGTSPAPVVVPPPAPRIRHREDMNLPSLDGLDSDTPARVAPRAPAPLPAQPEPAPTNQPHGPTGNTEKEKLDAAMDQLLAQNEEGQRRALEMVAKHKEENRVPEIIDGKEAKDLMESIRVSELESGDMVYAGTDKGIGYLDRQGKEKENEDRVAINPKENFVAVVDGMGGIGMGELAAQILAEDLLTNPRNIDFAVNQARLRMSERHVGEGGAVYISAKLDSNETTGKFLNISQSGDAKLIIIKKDGTVSFESKDESYVQTLLDADIITPDQALYNPERNVVTKAVTPKHEEDKPKFYPPVKVEDGDRVLLYSDGISDNFTPGEIAEMVKRGLSGKELFSWLSDATGKRMQNANETIDESERERNGMYSDGYRSKPKPDNRSLVILEIKDKKKPEPTPAPRGDETVKIPLSAREDKAKQRAEALAKLREVIENAKKIIEEEERTIAAREKRLVEIRTAKEFLENTKNYINNLTTDLRGQIQHFTEEGRTDVVESLNNRIKLLESDPVKYWSDEIERNNDVLNFLSNTNEFTEEEKSRRRALFEEQNEGLKKMITALEADLKK